MVTSKLHASLKASSFTESVIREMTRLADLHGAINLGQGFPDFAAPEAVKEAAMRAIAEDHNQYPVTWGVPTFRDAIAAKYERDYGMMVDPETEICVTCGSTEAMIATMLGVLDAGDEVVIFEPFYENYGPDSILSGAHPSARHAACSRLDVRRGGPARGVLRPDTSDRDQLAQQSHGQGVQPGRALVDRGALHPPRCDRRHRRDLRAHHL